MQIGMGIGGGANAGVIQVSSDPDGVLTAQRGTLAINTTTGTLWQNTTGSTVWAAIAYARASNTLAGNPAGLPWTTGRYYSVPWTTSLMTTSGSLGVGTLRVAPVFVPNSVTISRFAAEVTVIGDVGSKIRLGIYADDGTGRPGSLILDAGTINGDSATAQEITGLSTTIGPGYYYFGSVVQNVATTQPTIRTVQTGAVQVDCGGSLGVSSRFLGFQVTGVTGALPGSFGVAGTTGDVARMLVKI